MFYIYLFVKSTCMNWFTPACSSISQGTKRRHSSTAPFVTVGKIDLHVRFRHQWFSKNGLRPRRQFNPHDKIGRMPRGAQHPGTAQFFVDGAMVHAGRGDGAVCRKDERRKMTMAEKTIWRKKHKEGTQKQKSQNHPPKRFFPNSGSAHFNISYPSPVANARRASGCTILWARGRSIDE